MVLKDLAAGVVSSELTKEYIGPIYCKHTSVFVRVRQDPVEDMHTLNQYSVCKTAESHDRESENDIKHCHILFSSPIFTLQSSLTVQFSIV